MIRNLRSICTLALILSGLLCPIGSGEETVTEPPISPEEREHWAYLPVSRPSFPPVKNCGWVKSPVDLFILRKLETRGLPPGAPADRATLIRRLSYDLRGLPPTPQEVEKFRSDQRPDAYQRLVDRLLASPGYGEHWGRHWLDLARFAETDGFEHDKVRPEAWRYRDWVIEALNADLPYDQFVLQQLAADELAEDSSSIPTSFCLSGPDMPDINSQEERRHNLLNEMTATVGEVFLGLQLGCAQCHDHKYDPISQLDFYRLRSVFAPAVHVTQNKSVSSLHEPQAKPAPSHLRIRGDWRRIGPAVEPAFPRIANLQNESLISVPQQKSSGRRLALARWLTRPDHPLTSRVIANRVWHYHFGRGLSMTPSDFGTLGDEPSHPELLDWMASELVARDWHLKELHRLIVTSATYRQASQSSGNSADSDGWAERVESDPNNFYWSRFPRRRLSGEAIRDTLLSITGVLNHQRGGPGIYPPLPKELIQTLLRKQWQETPDRSQHHRRSIYVFARRNLRYPIFEAFDRPDGNASCARRDRSTTAPQSLLMLNSQFSLDSARRLAGRVLAESEQRESRIQLAVRLAFGREVLPTELERMRIFLETQSARLQAETQRADSPPRPLPSPAELEASLGAAWTDLCLALVNTNEFIYID